MPGSPITPTAGLVDLHCHLDLYPDHQRAIDEAESAGIFTLAVTTTPKAWPRNYELTKRTRHVRAALGIHPQLVAERANELDLWDRYLPETRYIGEVGLDAGPRFYKSLDIQKQVFRHVLERCAIAGGKIITVHSVRSVKTVLDLIETHFPTSRGKIVLHWFTGTKSEMQRAIELGCYFSINEAMLVNTKHAAMAAAIPTERLLTETDGPFTRAGNRPSKPSDVLAVVQSLGSQRGFGLDEMTRMVRDNLRQLLA